MLRDILDVISIVAWTAFLAPPIILFIRHRDDMRWHRVPFPVHRTGFDWALIVLSAASPIVLARIYF